MIKGLRGGWNIARQVQKLWSTKIRTQNRNKTSIIKTNVPSCQTRIHKTSIFHKNELHNPSAENVDDQIRINRTHTIHDRLTLEQQKNKKSGIELYMQPIQTIDKVKLK